MPPIRRCTHPSSPLLISSFSSFSPRGQPAPSLALPPDRSILDGLTVPTPIKILSVPDIEHCAASIGIKNMQYIGSYNWTNDEEPTIVIPGSPREWTNRPLPFTLYPDNGLRFVDENEHRMPDSPLLPLVIAADAVGAAVDWPHIDVLTDCNGLLKLVSWIDKGAKAPDFRIDVELAGERTLLMNRWEPNTRKQAGNGRSFGFGYEEATTTYQRGCERSAGHYRIIKYDFYDLRMVVRYHVDACLSPALRAGVGSGGDGQDQTSTAPESMSMRPTHTPTTITNTLKILHAGREVPQSSIIELASRSQKNIRKIDCINLFPQLYLSQTSLLYTGLHRYGEFYEIRKRDVADDSQMKEQYQATEGMFQGLSQLLREIRGFMVTDGGKRLSLVCEAGTLKVFERAATKSCLPDTILECFSTV
ncbi:hypothetical protein DENSPDRAFT_820992 [Dentipellis sp. KUC8613]|nr:hypothetical protein DENSPDRAFT_820992 [Dentipellis sp. KUC8613]